MGDLRQILAQGRKRIGLLLGAGAPAGVLVDPVSKKLNIVDGHSLIPVVSKLTADVIKKLSASHPKIVEQIIRELSPSPNIEMILSRVRKYQDLLGANKIHEYDGSKFGELAKEICKHIGQIVQNPLPIGPNPYSELATWIGGTDRKFPIEVFTTNYDLLMEEAFERAEIAYFDGFTGSHEPFFDPSTVATNDLPTRWARLWKLHGSLGWKTKVDSTDKEKEKVTRTGSRTDWEVIYPDYLKYEQIQKQPYTAFFDRLRSFLSGPDTLLVTCGFSFADRHVSAVIDEALTANPQAATFAFQYGPIDDHAPAIALSDKRRNFSLYARDAAIINCVRAPWTPGQLPTADWAAIRESFWEAAHGPIQEGLSLGDFAKFTRFFAMIHVGQIEEPQEITAPVSPT